MLFFLGQCYLEFAYFRANCLAIMVVLSKSYLQNFEKITFELALRFDIAPKAFHRYVDDSHTRFGSRNNANGFLNVLNSQDLQIQYTMEYENEHKEINFLDVTINNLNKFYDFAEYRKPAITNVQMKPHSNICSNIAMGVFKGFFSRPLHICSENYLPQEKDFLIKVFAENGHFHRITDLKKFTKKYINNITSKKEINTGKIKNDEMVKLPWAPKLVQKLRDEFKNLA